MFQSYLTEVALRKAVLDLSQNDKTLEQAQGSAVAHANILVKSQFDAQRQGVEMSLQETAITLALQAIRVAWNAMNEQLMRLGRARLDFDKERKSGIATFLVPTNKESRDLASEQDAMAAFIKYSQMHQNIFQYTGLRVDKVKEDSAEIEGQFISVLPYYQMSKFLAEPLASYQPCEKVRRAISLFFKTELPKFLKDIDQEFDDDYKMADFFRSAWRGDNFLNNYRGPRVIIMSLGNLLWNLQHPVDLETGFQLSLDDKITLCSNVGVYINRLLDPKTPPFLTQLDSDGSLTNFIRQVETYALELKEAYEQERLHSLNLIDVTSHAYAAARILDDNIFKLIFDKCNMAAELASSIGYLNLLLKRDPGLFCVLAEFEYDNHLINRPPKTLIDFLLAFFLLNDNQRKSVLKLLMGSKLNTRECFAMTLKRINKHFFKPIYQSCYAETQASFFNQKKDVVQRMAFNRFFPLIGLAAIDYRIELDTEQTKLAAIRAKEIGQQFYTGQQQIDNITKEAYGNEKNNEAFFSWDLSTYLTLSDYAEAKISQLPRRQYKIGQLTELLDSLQAFISQYKSFLQYTKFKNFVIHCLEAIAKEFSTLKSVLSEIELEISITTNENRRVIDTIKTMDQKLISEISKFTRVMGTVEEKIISPDFEDSIRKEVFNKLSAIEQKFVVALGHHEPGMAEFLTALSKKDLKSEMSIDERQGANDSTLNNESLSSGQFAKVSMLIMRCYQQMSNKSKSGRKGQILINLHRQLLKKNSLLVTEAKQIIMELIRVVCAYRPSLFFQASYGQTRSAKVLIKALVEHIDDPNFPIVSWLFNEDFQAQMLISANVESSIEALLIDLKEQKLWSASSDFLSEKINVEDSQLSLLDSSKHFMAG